MKEIKNIVLDFNGVISKSNKKAANIMLQIYIMKSLQFCQLIIDFNS